MAQRSKSSKSTSGKKVRFGRSNAEREAKTGVEKRAWAESRVRSERLLYYAQKLHDYLHNIAGAGDPTAVESAFKEADAIRYSMNCAISIRLARYEQEKKY